MTPYTLYKVYIVGDFYAKFLNKKSVNFISICQIYVSSICRSSLLFKTLLKSVFTNNLVSRLKCVQSRFAGDTKLGGAVVSLESREILQSVLEKHSDMVIGCYGDRPTAGLDDLSGPF